MKEVEGFPLRQEWRRFPSYTKNGDVPFAPKIEACFLRAKNDGMSAAFPFFSDVCASKLVDIYMWKYMKYVVYLDAFRCKLRFSVHIEAFRCARKKITIAASATGMLATCFVGLGDVTFGLE